MQLPVPTRIVEIEWVDSVHASGWINSEGFTFEGEDLNHRTVGYVVHDGEKTLAVVQSFSMYTRRDGTRNVDAIMEIPKVAIVSVKELAA